MAERVVRVATGPFSVVPIAPTPSGLNTFGYVSCDEDEIAMPSDSGQRNQWVVSEADAMDQPGFGFTTLADGRIKVDNACVLQVNLSGFVYVDPGPASVDGYTKVIVRSQSAVGITWSDLDLQHNLDSNNNTSIQFNQATCFLLEAGGHVQVAIQDQSFVADPMFGRWEMTFVGWQVP